MRRLPAAAASRRPSGEKARARRLGLLTWALPWVWSWYTFLPVARSRRLMNAVAVAVLARRLPSGETARARMPHPVP